MRFEHGQELVASLAPGLAVELVEQPLRAQHHEELQDLLQPRPQLGALPELAQPLGIEVLVAALAQGIDEGRLDLLLDGELLGQLEHGDRAPEVALVELLDGGVHQLAEARRRLLGGLREGDDLAHRVELQPDQGWGAARRRREAAPAGKGPGQGAQHLVHRGVDPELAQRSQVLLQLLRGGGLDGGGGHELRGHLAALLDGSEGRAPGRGAPGQGARGRGARDRGLQVLQEQRQSPQASGGLGREGCRCLGGSRGPGRFGARLAVEDRDGIGGGAGERGVAQAIQVLPQQLTVLLGTLWQQGLGHPAEAVRDLRLGNEVQLAHQGQLLRAVEEKVGHREVGGGRPLVRDPGADLRGQELRRLLDEQRHGIDHHQGGNAVGEVLLKLGDRFPQLGAPGRLAGSVSHLAPTILRGRRAGQLESSGQVTPPTPPRQGMAPAYS